MAGELITGVLVARARCATSLGNWSGVTSSKAFSIVAYGRARSFPNLTLQAQWLQFSNPSMWFPNPK